MSTRDALEKFAFPAKPCWVCKEATPIVVFGDGIGVPLCLSCLKDFEPETLERLIKRVEEET